MAGAFSQVLAVARYEWQIMLRNRWLAAFAVLFALLSGFLMYWQYVIYQGVSGTGFSKQTTQLVNLVLEFVPLMSFMLAAQSIAGDRSDGMISLLRAYPISSFRYIFGKWLGLYFSLFLSFLLGVGLPIGIASFIFHGEDIGKNLYLLLIGLVLTGVFSAMGLWIGGKVKGRLGAVSASLAIWLFLVFLYGILVMLIVPNLPYLWQKPTLAVLLAIDPVEAVRIGNVLLQGQGAVYGPEFVQWQRNLQGVWGYGLACFLFFLYISIPLGFAVRSLKRGGR